MREKKLSTQLHKFGGAIRSLRQEQGLSQEAFADLCNLDRTYIGGVERGERNVSFANIHKIANALSISVSTLFKLVEDTE